MDQYDLLVIGSGEAGKYLSWNMSRLGWRTALVERNLVGGSCPNVACMPSKNIIHSARIASIVRRADEFGVKATLSAIDMNRVFQRKQTMVHSLRQINIDLFKSTGVDFMLGDASFISSDKVSVRLKDGSERVLSANRIVLSLGSRSVLPPTPGLAEAQPMTHVEALDLTRLPDHLIIIGGSYIGLEFAQAFRRFGARVTVVEQSSRIASREDADISEAIAALFHDEGIEVLSNTSIRKVGGVSGQEVQILVDTPAGPREIQGSHLLVAAGRVPNTESVNLGAAEVKTDSRGYIVTDDFLATTSPKIWAVGDCAGTPQFTHAAYDDFCILKANFTGEKRAKQGRIVSSCLFIDPELSRIGLNESRARQLGIPYRLFTMPMSHILRTQAISETRGFMKMLVDLSSDQILGFTAFGTESSEMLAAVQTAMLGKLPYTLLRDGMFAHPTMSEGLVFLLSGEPITWRPDNPIAAAHQRPAEGATPKG